MRRSANAEGRRERLQSPVATGEFAGSSRCDGADAKMTGTGMNVDILLWAFLASFVLHVLDETLMNGGFVRWLQAGFWPTYTARMNFWFNGAFMLGVAVANALYDLLGGHWVIPALICPFGFAAHGVTLHLFWTIRQRNLSPGLLTSVLYWIMAYFFVRYGLLAGRISAADFWTGALLGVLTVGAFLTFVPTLVVPRLVRPRRV